MDSRVVTVHDVNNYAWTMQGVNKEGGNCCGSSIMLRFVVGNPSHLAVITTKKELLLLITSYVDFLF